MAAPAHTPTAGTFTVAYDGDMFAQRLGTSLVTLVAPECSGVSSPTTGQLWPRGDW